MSLNDVFTSAQTIMPRCGICQNSRFKTFWARFFAWRTLLPFRHFSIRVKVFCYKMSLGFERTMSKWTLTKNPINKAKYLRHTLRAGQIQVLQNWPARSAGINPIEIMTGFEKTTVVGTASPRASSSSSYISDCYVFISSFLLLSRPSTRVYGQVTPGWSD